jgi:Sec-independent protein secretion pathway component TatC
MTLYYNYYLELKNRLLLTVFTWISVLVTCYYFKEPLLFVFINLNKHYDKLDYTPYFIFINVSEIFYVYLQLIFFIANQIFILMVIYQTLMFLTLGLYNSEYMQLRSIFQTLLFTWICSILLFKEFIMPFSWAFFISFQETKHNLQPVSFFFEARILEYLNYFTNLYYACLLNCQILALVTFILNVISEKSGTIKVFRKLFYFVFIIFSTITTPPDITSQIIMSFALIILYEILIFLRCLKV